MTTMKIDAILMPSGRSYDVDERRVREHEREQQVAQPRLARAVGVERDRERRRAHEDQHAGRVRAPLGVHVRTEQDRDQEGDADEDQDERPVGLRPLGRHAVARQVSRDEIEQPDQGGRAGEPQDRDGADVVDGAEHVAQVPVGEVGERPAVGGAPCPILRRWNHQRGDDAAADEQHAHDHRRRGQQFVRVADAPDRTRLGVAGVSLHERHDRHARFESRQSQRELREEQQGNERPSRTGCHTRRCASIFQAENKPGCAQR